MDSYVGGVWCEGYGILSQDKGLLVLDPILASDVQVAPLLPGRLVFHILIDVESLVGKKGGVCEGHGKFRRQVGREVGDMGKSN